MSQHSRRSRTNQRSKRHKRSRSSKSSVSRQKQFLRHFSKELSVPSKTNSRSRKSTYFVAVADFALISHLKDKYGKKHITNHPGVLNIAVYTNTKQIPQLFEHINEQVLSFINKQPNNSDFRVEAKECSNNTLPCILRVFKGDQLFADFLMTTKPFSSKHIDFSLSHNLGFSIKKLETVL
jgi:hypothetical protein